MLKLSGAFLPLHLAVLDSNFQPKARINDWAIKKSERNMIKFLTRTKGYRMTLLLCVLIWVVKFHMGSYWYTNKGELSAQRTSWR
jgi:hypothetical protein